MRYHLNGYPARDDGKWACCSCKTEKSLSDFYRDRSKKNGHSNKCKTCTDARRYAYFYAHPEKLRSSIKKWTANNLAAVKAYQREWVQANPEKVRAKTARWRLNNPEKNALVQANRLAAKLRATPAWANEFFIFEIYELAVLRTRALGIQHTVDHIVPLQGKTVCGLHWEGNLQILTKSENSTKGNRHWPDMP